MNTAIWLIAGVGTDAGKTVTAAALGAALRKDGVDCQIIKPVQSGCIVAAGGGRIAPDAAAYHDADPGVKAEALACFVAPCSPPLAARLEGVSIDPASLVREVRDRAAQKPVTLVEAAGGLLTPIGETYCFADLAAELDARVVLVGDNSLGAINAFLLSLEALRHRGVAVEAVVANRIEAEHGDADLCAAIREDNIAAIRRAAPEAAVLTLFHFPGLSSLDAEERQTAWRTAGDQLQPLVNRIGAFVRTGEASDAVCAFDRQHLWHPYASTHPPVRTWHVESTSGCRIRLADGRELVDGTSSWWSAVHGYNHPRLLDALRRQAAKMPHVMFGGLTHRPASELGEKLLDIVPEGMDRVFFADSGSVAVEAALKMALQYQQAVGRRDKRRFLAPLGGYHGDTMGAMSVCDPVNGMHQLFSGVLPEQLFVDRFACPFDGEFDAGHVANLESAFAKHGGEIAAVIAEPVVQNAGGMWFYHPRYLGHLRRLCDAHGALLILDEIATGFGRTGRMFASEWAGVRPDIMCVGKALTGGIMTLSAVLCGDAVASAISREGVFMHGPTFMANPLACAVAAASLELLENLSWRDKVLGIERGLRKGLESCRGVDGIADVRVLGAIGVVETERAVNAARLQEFFVEQGVWIRPFARLIYLMPPYVIGADELDALTAAVRSAVETRQWE